MRWFHRAIEKPYSVKNWHLNSGYRVKQKDSSESDMVEICVMPAIDLDHEFFNHKKISFCGHSYMYSYMNNDAI
ncbi:hypothetical protein Hdeb2414_s0005g00162261 [Helianthus debilis subsp. tardiflorus]